MDIGGFSVPPRFSAEKPKPEDAEEWRELNTRWFQFGTFVPLLRAHGEAPNREMWEMGGESHAGLQTQLKFDRLRYRLLPYLYSLAGAVTQQGGHDDAAAGDGLPRRRQARATSATSSCSARRCSSAR